MCRVYHISIINFLRYSIISWFKPRELENIPRQQGLNGTPYRPFPGDVKNMMILNEADKRKTINLSDDTSPHVFGYYYQIIAKCGKNSFMWFGPWPRLNIADPELIKEILSRPDAFQQPLLETGKILTGGIVFLQDEKWAKHRKIINPNMVPLIGLSCSSILQSEIDVWPDLQDLTGDVISRTAFGSSNEEGKRIFQLQRDKTELTLEIFQLTMIPGWRGVKPCLMKTTTETRMWAMVLLCQNPDWQTRAREEVDRVFGNEEPSFESLTHLKTHSHENFVSAVIRSAYSQRLFPRLLRQLTMILQESLRLYPPAPLMTRGSTKTLKLGNMTIPPGFNPHRFSEGVSNAASTQSAYIPFGAGQRVCIGQNLVLIEAKIALAMILQSFSFELSPSYLHAPFNDINLLPIYGAPMILRSL
ncbi:hypothetical protein ACP275_08G202100 [Erythranthe tilingii]